MPPNDRLWGYDDERPLPTGPNPLHRDPEQLVDGRQLQSRVTSLKNRKLLPEDQVLHEKITTGAEQTTSEPKYYSEKAKHGPQLYRTTDEVGRLKLLIVQIAMILARDKT